MFIATRYGGYNRRGEQSAGGEFLIVFAGEKDYDPAMPLRKELRACVRYVRMTQLGHFMMGSVRVGPATIILSGEYGHDGLPLRTPNEEVWKRLVPLPRELMDAFWSGGGHNSAGVEGPAMRKWALENYKALRVAGSKKGKEYPEWR